MKKLLITGAALAVLAPAAFASNAYLKVSPGTQSNPANIGTKVKVTGAVGNGCQVGHKGDVATIYSKAFSTKHKFAGVPSVNAPLDSQGHFSVKVQTIRSAGLYTVSGRCGGAKFGSTKLYLTVGRYW